MRGVQQTDQWAINGRATRRGGQHAVVQRAVAQRAVAPKTSTFTFAVGTQKQLQRAELGSQEREILGQGYGVIPVFYYSEHIVERRSKQLEHEPRLGCALGGVAEESSVALPPPSLADELKDDVGWVHGRVGTWARGCMGAWVHGCMYERVGPWR